MGTGHIMRCIALGQAWKRLGGDMLIASRTLPSLLQARLDDECFACVTVPEAMQVNEEPRDLPSQLSKAKKRSLWLWMDTISTPRIGRR